MKTQGTSRIFKPNPKYVMTETTIAIPRSPKTAFNIPEWKSAMEKEFRALQKNGTWILIPRITDDNVINTKWIFKVKYNYDGSIKRFKARLVVNGLRQIQGSDYEDTFSPVVQPLSIQLVLTIVVSMDWSIHQIDISNAFLHS